jgi:hypothetical protein
MLKQTNKTFAPTRVANTWSLSFGRGYEYSVQDSIGVAQG